MNDGQSGGLRTIAIAGGKGGVGKTIISANLAVAIAQRLEQESGWVLAVDLDVGCGNLNWCLGVADARQNINHFLRGEVNHLTELIGQTEQPQLCLICSSYTGVPPADLSTPNRERLIAQLPQLGARFAVLDLGAGSSVDILDLFLQSDYKLVVVNPDPLSLQNSFIFLKTAILKFLNQELEKKEFLSPLKASFDRLIAEQENLNLRMLLEELKQWDTYAAYVLAGLVDDLTIHFVVNMYRDDEAERTYLKQFHHLLFRDLCLRNNINYLGFVHHDEGFKKAVQGGKPFLHTFPTNRAASDLRLLAERLLAGQEIDNIPALHFPDQQTGGWKPFWRK